MIRIKKQVMSEMRVVRIVIDFDSLLLGYMKML
jgi:hypothetical protein